MISLVWFWILIEGGSQLAWGDVKVFDKIADEHFLVLTENDFEILVRESSSYPIDRRAEVQDALVYTFIESRAHEICSTQTCGTKPCLAAESFKSSKKKWTNSVSRVRTLKNSTHQIDHISFDSLGLRNTDENNYYLDALTCTSEAIQSASEDQRALWGMLPPEFLASQIRTILGKEDLSCTDPKVKGATPASPLTQDLHPYVKEPTSLEKLKKKFRSLNLKGALLRAALASHDQWEVTPVASVLSNPRGFAASVATRLTVMGAKSLWEKKDEKSQSLAEVLQAFHINIEKNREFLSSSELIEFRKLRDQAHSALKAYTETKKEALARTLKDPASMAVKEVVEMTDSVVPTLIDLKTNPSLKEVFDKVIRASKIPLHPRKKITDPEERAKKTYLVKERCTRELATRPEDFRNRLLGISSGFSETPEERSLHYYVGEPGGGKTTGIEATAACSKVPVCTFVADQMNTRWAEKAKQSKKPSVSEMFKEMFTDCILSQFKDEVGTPISTGVLLLDDLDRFLDVINPEQREELFRLLKELSDNANKTFVDPVSGMPVNISEVQLFVTANSIPVELKEDSPDQFRSLMSRTDKYMVPSPKESDRKFILEATLKDLFDRVELEAKKGKSDFKLAESIKQGCKIKILEILEYDLARSRLSGGTLGVRGLVYLAQIFEDVMYGRLIAEAKTSSANGCIDHDREIFDVKAYGDSCGDYQKGASEGLEEDQFLRTLEGNRLATLEDLSSHVDSKVAEGIQAEFEKLKQNPDRASVGTRKLRLEALLNRIHFSATQVDFSSADSKRRLKANFQARFSYLDPKRDSGTYGMLSTVYNTLAGNLIGRGDKPNSVILVKPQSTTVEPSGLVLDLTEGVGVPLCRLTEKSQVFEEIFPKWWGFRGPRDAEGEKYGSLVTIDCPQKGKFTEYDDTYKAYKYQQGKDWYFSIKELGKWKCEKFSEEEMKVKQPRTQWKWLSHCLAQWSSSELASYGTIYLNVPDLVGPELEKAISSIHQAINQPFYSDPDVGTVDLSKISVFFSPPSTETSKMESLFRRERVSTLDLIASQVPITARGSYAESVLKSKLEQLGYSIEKINEEETVIFQEIKKFDQEKAKDTKGEVSTVPLVTAIQDFLVREVDGRFSDSLGLRPKASRLASLRSRLASYYQPFMIELLAAKQKRDGEALARFEVGQEKLLKDMKSKVPSKSELLEKSRREIDALASKAKAKKEAAARAKARPEKRTEPEANTGSNTTKLELLPALAPASPVLGDDPHN